jgi:hypothetical protein
MSEETEKKKETPAPANDLTVIATSAYDGTSIQVTAQSSDKALDLFKKVREEVRRK